MQIRLNRSFPLKSLTLALAIAISPWAMAQETSSAITGRITDTKGAPIAGATVEILHVPTGNRKTVTTDAQGRYNSKGLRTGGPYVITAQKDGLDAAKEDNVSLKLGETGTVNVLMKSTDTLEDVVVTGARSFDTTFDPTKMGASTVVTRDDIDRLPSISRSINDFLRLDPRISQTDKGTGAISAAGQNSRFNSVTIDGVPTNDEFGLNAGGLPSLNQPISLDTIQELSIGIAGFDVTTSDATGANVNAVTKSGTNTFAGTYTAAYRKQNWVGDNELNQKFTGFNSELTNALTFGGPILQDRLFFFVAIEDFKAKNPAPTLNQVISNGVASPIFSDAQIGSIRTAASTYGFQLGSSSIPGITNQDKKYLAKVDWTINDAHRLSLRWNRTKGETLEVRDNSNTSVSFSDHWFNRLQTNTALVLNEYSDWSDSFNTEFSISRSEYESLVPLVSNTPEVTINEGSNRFLLGGERFRHANRLDVKTTTAFLAGNYFVGDHTIKGGLDFKRTDIFNLFLESAYGRYEFSSIANFVSGNVFRYTLRYPGLTGPGTSPNSAAADWAIDNVGLFLQDTWAVNGNLTVNYGVRIDIPRLNDAPVPNALLASAPSAPAVGSFKPRGGLGLDNTGTPDGNYVVEPRVGFNYTFDSDRKMQLRGGVGLFTGSPPGVWLSNNYSETGTLISEFITQAANTPITADPTRVPTPTGTGVAPRATVNLLDKNFEMPTVWKANLALEAELPWYGLIGSAEVLLTQTKTGIFYDNLNLGSPGGRLPDGRFHYWQSTSYNNFSANPAAPAAGAGRRFGENANFLDVLQLRNTTKGKATNVTVGLEKPLEESWGGKIAYTYGRASEPNPGFEARAITNWSQRPVFNANEEIDAPSNFEIRNRMTMSFTYRHQFFADLFSTMSIFGERRSGRNFSYVYLNDANGDNANSSNDLFYVPLDRNDVAFRDIVNAAGVVTQSAATQANLFWNYIEGNEYLNSHRGQVAGRNAGRNPWVTQLDVRFAQELPGFGSIKPEVYLDIANVGNLISSKYGRIDETPTPLVAGVASFAGTEANPLGGTRYIYRFTAAPNIFVRQDNRAQSRWAAQVGLRFAF
jgi:hypothetical protein